MPPAFSWFLARRYLVTRWVNLVGILGIALAVWAMIVVVAVFSGFIGATEQGIREASPDLLITGLRPDSDFVALREVLAPHATALAPRLSHDAILFPIGGWHIPPHTRPIAAGAAAAGNNYVLVLGIDAAAEARVTPLRQWLQDVDEPRTDGRPLDPTAFRVDDLDDPFSVSPARIRYAAARMGQDDRTDALLGPERGILLGMLRLRGGDQILPGQRADVVSARFVADPETEGFALRKIKINTYLSGAYATDHKFFDLGTCLIDIEVLRSAMGEGALTDRQLVSEIAVRLPPDVDPVAAKSRIEAALQPFGGGTARTWIEQNQTYISAVNRERTLMKIVLFAVLVVAGFLIFATLHMMVVQKTKDIGILTSLGATPGGIGAVFVASSLIIGMTGCTLGVVTGIVSALSLNWVFETLGMPLFPPDLYAINEVPINLEPGWIAQVVIGALVLSLLVAWLPARRAARLDPVKALMHE